MTVVVVPITSEGSGSVKAICPSKVSTKNVPFSFQIFTETGNDSPGVTDAFLLTITYPHGTISCHAVHAGCHGGHQVTVNSHPTTFTSVGKAIQVILMGSEVTTTPGIHVLRHISKVSGESIGASYLIIFALDVSIAPHHTTGKLINIS